MTQGATWWEIAAFQRAAHNQSQDAMLLAAGSDGHVWQQASITLMWHSAMLGSAEQMWLAVADGVAAGPCGALASRSFLAALQQAQAASPSLSPVQVVCLAHDRWQARHLRECTQGASTTLASMTLKSGRCTAINCGDSRVWRLRASARDQTMDWLQLTTDHTAWETLVAEGQVSAGQRSDYASIYGGLMHCLTLGHTGDSCAQDDGDEVFAAADEYPKLQSRDTRIEVGDVLLIATDGLHDCVTDQRREALWRFESTLPENLRALRAEVCRLGVPDDCTVIACQRLK